MRPTGSWGQKCVTHCVWTEGHTETWKKRRGEKTHWGTLVINTKRTKRGADLRNISRRSGVGGMLRIIWSREKRPKSVCAWEGLRGREREQNWATKKDAGP